MRMDVRQLTEQCRSDLGRTCISLNKRQALPRLPQDERLLVRPRMPYTHCTPVSPFVSMLIVRAFHKKLNDLVEVEGSQQALWWLFSGLFPGSRGKQKLIFPLFRHKP